MPSTPKPIHEELESLQGLDAPALRTLWLEAFGRPAPMYARRDLLLRALSYHVQAQTAGGLRPAAHRRLARTATELQEGKDVFATSPRLRPGTRLMREWKGDTHVVEVLADGFAWRGAYYASLSAAARAITGVRWSGPRFFGLQAKRPPSEGATFLRAGGDSS